MTGSPHAPAARSTPWISYLVALGTSILLLLILGACQADDDRADEATDPEAAPADPITEREELVVRLSTQDIQDLDPAFMGTIGSRFVGFNIYNLLVRMAPGTTDVIPDLAREWEVSEDGTVYTFYLHEGVQWHRGYGEVTAHDVKYSFERIMDPDLESPQRPDFDMIDEIEVVDDYTVRLHLVEPDATLLLSVLAQRSALIVSEAALTEMGQEEHALNPVGSGPFVFENWIPDSEVYLSANDDYFLGPPQISGVRLRVLPDENVVALGLETGEVQAAILETAPALATVDRIPEIHIETLGSLLGRFVYMNNTAPPLDNVLVRRALSHATDRDAISQAVFDGWHHPNHTLLLPSVWAHTDDVTKYDFDLDAARELLEEAGYADGFQLRVLYSDRAADEGIVLAMQDMWGQLGIDLELIGLDHPVYTSERRENPGDYDLIVHHNSNPGDPHAWVHDQFHSGSLPPGGANHMFYNNAVVDRLIAEGRVEVDPDRRREIYEEIQQILMDDAPAIPIVHTTMAVAIRPEVHGLSITPDAMITFHSATVQR